MKNLQLKNVLEMPHVIVGININLFTSTEETFKAIKKVLEQEENNSIEVMVDRNIEPVKFLNKLHVDKDSSLYLLESRLFTESDSKMIEAYLLVMDDEGNTIDEEIDDVWSYGNWDVVK